jgi:subtilisin family serine protease
MTNHEYVILRVDPNDPRADDPEVLGGTEIGTGPLEVEEARRDLDVVVETAVLSDKDIQHVRQERQVLGVAPSMPLKLISPVAAADDRARTEASADKIAWGITAVGAADAPFTGAGVKVAILDTGIAADHPAFNGVRLTQKDFTGEGDGDENGHGTHCAGTVFGRDVDGTRIGVARGITDVLIGKVLTRRGMGSTANLAAGIHWAVTNNANIISISIGLDFTEFVRKLVEERGFAIAPATSLALSAYRETIRMFDAISQMVRSAVGQFGNSIVIAAAGNESKRPRYTIDCAPPAAAEGFISVGALEKHHRGSLKVASFSNTSPRVVAPGARILSANLGGGLTLKDGTSMATPHVAGVAALWLESLRTDNPQVSIRTLDARLTGTASLSRISDPSDRHDSGSGLVRAPH